MRTFFADVWESRLFFNGGGVHHSFSNHALPIIIRQVGFGQEFDERSYENRIEIVGRNRNHMEQLLDRGQIGKNGMEIVVGSTVHMSEILRIRRSEPAMRNDMVGA